MSSTIASVVRRRNCGRRNAENRNLPFLLFSIIIMTWLLWKCSPLGFGSCLDEIMCTFRVRVLIWLSIEGCSLLGFGWYWLWLLRGEIFDLHLATPLKMDPLVVIVHLFSPRSWQRMKKYPRFTIALHFTPYNSNYMVCAFGFCSHIQAKRYNAVKSLDGHTLKFVP